MQQYYISNHHNHAALLSRRDHLISPFHCRDPAAFTPLDEGGGPKTAHFGAPKRVKRPVSRRRNEQTTRFLFLQAAPQPWFPPHNHRHQRIFRPLGKYFFSGPDPATPSLRPPRRTGKSTSSNNQMLVSTDIDAVINNFELASPVKEITSFPRFIAEIRPPSPRSTRVEGQKRPILWPQNGSNALYLVDEMSKSRDFCFCEQPRNHSFHRTIIGTNEYFARSGDIFFPVRTPPTPHVPTAISRTPLVRPEENHGKIIFPRMVGPR